MRSRPVHPVAHPGASDSRRAHVEVASEGAQRYVQDCAHKYAPRRMVLIVTPAEHGFMLVNHMNFIDQTYRIELRELNELNFARFDAKIEQRAMQLDAKWEKRFAKVDQRFGELDAKWEKRFAKVDQRFAELDAKIDKTAGELRGEIVASSASCKADLIKTVFIQILI